MDPNEKGKKAGTVVLEAPAGNLSLSIGLCTFVYEEEPREAKPVVRAEAEAATVSALSVFFPSNEVFVFYELREPLGKLAFRVGVRFEHFGTRARVWRAQMKKCSLLANSRM